ncbi:lysophospholipid acyltransferase family protein [Rubellimicrobium aerolatum]|uniref:Lysophospholipid acyltransferase family protein n=1 Tax=Rubellimicrobium aerolatum TaxID=490979 RepID=A0ABW0S9B9_9RHOB|nr:lysophospholipid acyltransferase family protein [Rubellimicrobium aerolatum]MBP1804903.1 hypothetical protein [Rubellimicrobium aerolatum]
MTRFFAGVMARQMAGAFRAVRLARPGVPELPEGRPVIVYTNHPSWWDPAFVIVLHSRLFPGREGYGPMEAAMLERYGFFRRIGLFGVEEGRVGAARFLATSGAILADPRRMLWVTAQGRFADPRERPLGLRPGVAHLMARVPGAVAVPLALEYPFWSEKRPEALAAFGTPQEGGGDAAAWGPRLEAALGATCDRLAALAQARDPGAFGNVLAGKAGVGGIYGAWQRLRALARGERHVPDHMAEGGR